MKRIFICSPYAGNIELNIKVAQAMCRQAIDDGYAPFAPHLHYPGIVDDSVPEDRERGIKSGLAFLELCDEVWAFMGYGISSGMAQELAYAKRLKKPIMEFSGIRRDFGGLGDELPEIAASVYDKFIFNIGPSGGVPVVSSFWQEKIKIICQALLKNVGPNPKINYWPYRCGQTEFFAFDITGEKGWESLSIVVDDLPYIPTATAGDIVFGVVDSVDVYYLSATLISELSGTLLSYTGGRTMAK